MKSEEELDIEAIEDQVAVVGKLTPREYGRLRGISPQVVYYHVRQGTIKLEHCQCGRRVLVVADTDKALQEKAIASGRKLDTRADPQT